MWTRQRIQKFALPLLAASILLSGCRSFWPAREEAREVSEEGNHELRRQREANAPPKTGVSSTAQQIERNLGIP